MRGLFAAMIAGAGVVAGAGCVAQDQTACSEPDAVPGFALYLHETPGFTAGVYAWTITADGKTRVRHVTLDPQSLKGQCGDCAPGVDDDLWITMERDHAAISVVDDPNGRRQAGPAHLAIGIERVAATNVSAATIATFTFDPIYRPVHDDCQSILRAQYLVDVVGP